MSNTAPFGEASWSWSDIQEEQEPAIKSEFADHPEAFKEEEASHDEPQDQHRTTQESPTENADPPPQRHYPSRTCRICLEEVFPSFEPIPEGVSRMFNPAPKVAYISSEAESGRLIRPCKCRGSQAYVHEGCLQEWRHADSSYGRRTYYECPTCKFQYRLERIKWSRWLTSTTLQVSITFAIMFGTIFIFGFIADPIINLYLDPFDTITTTATTGKMPAAINLEEDATWGAHFLKGLASLGLLGFAKVFFAMSPTYWWNIRQGGILGGGRNRRGGRQGGRERLENISWTVVIIGVLTFLFAVWRWVRAWTLRTLEKAGERVADVQGDDEAEDEPQPTAPDPAQAASSTPGAENRKDQ